MSEQFWWINQSESCRLERAEEYVWFQKGRRETTRSESARNIMRVLPGDVFFVFAADCIEAIGVALGTARATTKPADLLTSTKAFGAFATEGWLVPVRFTELETPLRPGEHCARVDSRPAGRSAPVRPGGEPRQRVQLAAVPSATVDTLRRLLDGEMERIVDTLVESAGSRLCDDVAEEMIQRRTDLTPPQKAGLIKARHGKGMFREALEEREQACRVTGLLDRRHLKAVHIKPWCECTQEEMIDGDNGLLFSAHIGDLFVRGYLSFADDGEMLVSDELNPAVLLSWNVSLPVHAGRFSESQRRYLAYHRKEVFEQHRRGRRQRALMQTRSLAANGDGGAKEPPSVQRVASNQ